MKIKFLIVISLVFSITLFGISSIYADGITIGKRSSLALNDASIDLGCLNITIEDTGTLDMGSGTISGLKNLYINPDALLNSIELIVMRSFCSGHIFLIIQIRMFETFFRIFNIFCFIQHFCSCEVAIDTTLKRF